MTEAEWLAASEPYSMLQLLRGHGEVTRRKLQLFLAGCARRIDHFRDDPTWPDEDSVNGAKFRAQTDTAKKLANLDWFDEVIFHCGMFANDASDGGTERHREVAEDAAQAGLLRDIIGNPFHPISGFDLAWLEWNDGIVARLARTAYDDRLMPERILDPARLLILADALEDAGCTDAELLNHLRAPGPHVRGCWAVDLVLGKE